MRPGEFEAAVLAELREVRAEQIRQGQQLTAHCAAEEALKAPRAPLSARISTGVNVVLALVTLGVLVSQHVK